MIECSAAAAEGVANTAVREPWPFTASLLWQLWPQVLLVCCFYTVGVGVLDSWLGWGPSPQARGTQSGRSCLGSLVIVLISSVSYSFHVLMSSMGHGCFPTVPGQLCVLWCQRAHTPACVWCKVRFRCLQHAVGLLTTGCAANHLPETTLW